jgi:hypothetical protein
MKTGYMLHLKQLFVKLPKTLELLKPPVHLGPRKHLVHLVLPELLKRLVHLVLPELLKRLARRLTPELLKRLVDQRP